MPGKGNVTESRGLARIGVVVPVSNTNLEPDLVMMRPTGVSLHFMRVGGYDLDEVPDSRQMRSLAAASLDHVIDALKATLADVILYGCTSATLVHGPDFDNEFRSRIERRARKPAATAAGAVVEALRDLNVRRMGFCSPYTRELSAEAASFFKRSGYEVVSAEYVGRDLGNYGQGELSPEEVFRLARSADRSDADAVVLSCTDMRSVEIIEDLEQALGKPVVTSNQALMHAGLKRLGLASDTIPGALGRCLRADLLQASA